MIGKSKVMMRESPEQKQYEVTVEGNGSSVVSALLLVDILVVGF